MARFKIRKELSIFVAILRACVKVRNAVLPPKCGCAIKLQLFQSQSRSPDSKWCPDAVYQLPIVLGWSWTLHNALSENITNCFVSIKIHTSCCRSFQRLEYYLLYFQYRNSCLFSFQSSVELNKLSQSLETQLNKDVKLKILLRSLWAYTYIITEYPRPQNW